MSERHDLIIDGNRIHARMEGREDGPWLTCLHGAATSLHLWDRQVPALAGDFRILRIDVRGHGLSSAENPSSTFAELVADVVAVWDALGIGRSSVLGLSLGGMTGFGLALSHPDRVERLVAADCRADAPGFFVESWHKRLAILAEKGMAGIADVTLPAWMTETTRAERPDIIDGARAMIMTTTAQGYLSVARPLMALDYKKDLARISCPTLLVVGDLDGPHPEEMEKMAALIPGARLAVVEGAGHLSCFEQPDRFNAAVLPFLRGG